MFKGDYALNKVICFCIDKFDTVTDMDFLIFRTVYPTFRGLYSFLQPRQIGAFCGADNGEYMHVF